VEQNVAASTQNQAFNALLFLYREVLHQALDTSIEAIRAKNPNTTQVTREPNNDPTKRNSHRTSPIFQ
jgi:hypothetical protein